MPSEQPAATAKLNWSLRRRLLLLLATLRPAATLRPTWSLRRRLLLLTATATLVAWLAGGAATYFISHRQLSMLSDERLQSVAQTLLTLTDHEIDEIRLAGRGLIHVDEDSSLAHRYRYQVWSPSGELLLTNGHAQEQPIAPFDQVGFVTRDFEGAQARTIVAWSEDRNKLIQIAEPLALRETFPYTAFASLFGLFLFSLAALLAIDAWMIRRATRALQDSARQLTQRSPTDLRPIEVSAPPREIQPLVKEINALFRRFANALENERRFTSAAAHELRTPLAAVKVHAQVAQLTRTAAERKQILDGFQERRYRVIVTSRVLNEGVDVPEAKVAIVLGGTSGAREYVQRLGRVLRKIENRQAVLFEVIARKTVDEGKAQRRRQGGKD